MYSDSPDWLHLESGRDLPSSGGYAASCSERINLVNTALFDMVVKVA